MRPILRDDIYYSKSEIIDYIIAIKFKITDLRVEIIGDRIKFILPNIIMNFKCEFGLSCEEEFKRLFTILNNFGIKVWIVNRSQ